MAYSDPSVTDNPQQRAFDHTRRLQSLPIKNPRSDSIVVPSGSSFTVFDGTVSTGLSGTSELDIGLVSNETSIYLLEISAGSGAFKTARSVSSITGCVVTVNNNVVVDFDFTGATVSAVQPGDLMRIKGVSTYDTGVFAFNPLNAGLWKVINVSGSKVSVIRLVGEPFSGVAESLIDASADVEFYADDGAQKGYKFELAGNFSFVSKKVYEILDSTPTKIYFVSASPLPTESAVIFTSGAITIFKASKKFMYIECDQDCIVRFNADTSDNNKLNPISAGDKDLPAFINKYGDCYSCTIVNKSINAMNVKFFMGE
jgi:hypothetical protein